MSGTTTFDCPRCGAGLTMSERQGIEIDYCPQCRGVWLDRGELDKIIERTGMIQGPPPSQPAPIRQVKGLRADGPSPPFPRRNSSPGLGPIMAMATGRVAKSGSPGWRRSSTDEAAAVGPRAETLAEWSLRPRGSASPLANSMRP